MKLDGRTVAWVGVIGAAVVGAYYYGKDRGGGEGAREAVGRMYNYDGVQGLGALRAGAFRGGFGTVYMRPTRGTRGLGTVYVRPAGRGVGAIYMRPARLGAAGPGLFFRAYGQ